MKKHRGPLRATMLLVLAMVGGSLGAEIPNGYYDDASGKTGTELRQALHDIIDNHTSISYSQIWNAFWSTDNKGNGVVWDMYSDGAGYTYNLGSDECGSYSGEGTCYNREHSWPQSWFNDQTKPRTDLHHIFPTDGYVNAQRSNHPFGEVQNASWTSQNGSKLGSCRTSGYSGTVFEPIDEYKGDFARAYFYMSTRYYGEDSNWGSSSMTNKAEILPWAMTMLLRWSDNDPVSQKEIDRNNAVYGIQGNRNPFIDHPEYAHLIWDENYQGGVAYNITCATNLQNGSISAPSSAVEGFTVNLYAYPAAGYMVDTWHVWKTNDPYTTLTVTNNSFVMPAYDVTVSATFVQNTTPYAITCLTRLSHGSISVSTNSAMSGTNIVLSNTPATSYSLYSYYVYETGNINNIVYSGRGNSFVMPAFDVTVTASFSQGTSSGGDYVKVTSAPASWSGEYLIVYESENKAFDGSLTSLDATNNCISVTITNNTIASNATTNASQFTIAPMTGGYSIQAASGKYIGNGSDSNGLTSSSNTPLANTLTFNNNNVDIVSSGGAYLRFNNQSGQNRFRYFKSSTYTNQQAIQLYKKGEGSLIIPTHKVHFYGNGGLGTMSDQTVDEFVPTSLNANTFTREGYAFVGWNTAANGSGVTYYDEGSVTLLQDLMLYAQWDLTYDITCLTVEHGTIGTSVTEAAEGAVVTLIATQNSGYEVDYWEVTDANNEPVEVIGNQFVMPGSDVTVSAGFVYVGTSYAQRYYLVTSADQLEEGRTYLMVNTEAGRAMGFQSGAEQNGNNRDTDEVTINDGIIASIENTTVRELTLGQNNGHWTLFDEQWGTSGGYLYAASNSANQLKTRASNDDTNGEWSISIAADGTATIVALGNNTRRHIRYNSNSGNPVFACYASNSTLPQVELYVRSEEYEHTASTTLARLFTYDQHTIRNGATLTVNQVVGKDLCNRAGHLIIEEGGQLVHSEAGINALVKKSIAAYSGNGGWYTISMPFSTLDPDEVENMTVADYDLYAYDEDGNANGKEWVNHKSNGGFNLSPSAGYLYAHNPAITLRMEGALNVGTYSETVNLGYANGAASIQGFNLLGNPVAHEISFTKTAEVSDGYYYLANSGNWVYETGNTVPVGRGFMVKANASNQSVTLNPQSKRGEDQEKGQFLCVSVGEEKAYVKLNEGLSMPLLDMRGHHSRLYLQSERQSYVMLVRDGAEVLDLCYEAHGNGPQTLKVDTDGLGLNSLHLIDNKTGANVDLLATSSYQFEAKEGDYVTRFRLVFGPSTGSGSEGSTPFAYYADGEIRLSETCHGALLQIVDMTGRVVFMGDVSGNVSTKGMTPGVYVLRLVADDGIRVQKMVLK